MTVLQLFNQARDILQDANKDYWSDSELLDYFNSGIRIVASERLERPTKKTIALSSISNEYTVSDVLRYISVVDSNGRDRKLYSDDGSGDSDQNGIIVLDYNKIYVNTPETGVSLIIKHISFPEPLNLSSDIRVGDENLLRYYVVAKAFEKESDLENFQKAQYFNNEFKKELDVVLKNNKVNYINNIRKVKGYYY